MAIDTKAIEEHIRGILLALGEDPDREGLRETPERVARMYEEIFEDQHGFRPGPGVFRAGRAAASAG